MTSADFIAVLDSAPRPNGAPVPVEDAREHLRRMESAFAALTASEAWTATHTDPIEAAAQGDMQQRAIDAMQEARAAWRQAQRRAREAARVKVDYFDEDA